VKMTLNQMMTAETESGCWQGHKKKKKKKRRRRRRRRDERTEQASATNKGRDRTETGTSARSSLYAIESNETLELARSAADVRKRCHDDRDVCELMTGRNAKPSGWRRNREGETKQLMLQVVFAIGKRNVCALKSSSLTVRRLMRHSKCIAKERETDRTVSNKRSADRISCHNKQSSGRVTCVLCCISRRGERKRECQKVGTK
jgi:hypothetical protein